MLRKRKKISNKLRVGIFSFLTVAIGYNYMKTLFFGNPPSKIRKALFYTSIGALFIYNSYGDEIGKFSSDKYNDLYALINNPVQEENEILETNLEKMGLEKKTLQDSVAKLNNSLDYIILQQKKTTPKNTEEITFQQVNYQKKIKYNRKATSLKGNADQKRRKQYSYKR